MVRAVSVRKTIPEKGIVDEITAARLKQIIVEEYIKEEMLDESQAAQDLLRQILGDEEYSAVTLRIVALVVAIPPQWKRT